MVAAIVIRKKIETRGYLVFSFEFLVFSFELVNGKHINQSLPGNKSACIFDIMRIFASTSYKYVAGAGLSCLVLAIFVTLYFSVACPEANKYYDGALTVLWSENNCINVGKTR